MSSKREGITMPETMEIMETVSTLIEYDRGWLDNTAADQKVIGRLVSLGWEYKRAETAVRWAVKEWH